MSFQLLLTLALVLGAVLWLASRSFRRASPDKLGGCEGCGSGGTCPACPKAEHR